MKKQFKFYWVSLFFLALLPLMGGAKSVSLPAENLMGVLKDTRTYQGRFQQSIVDANGENISQTQGTIKVQRPGKFYWTSKAPDSIMVIADGTFVWTYDVELEQVTKNNIESVLGSSPAALLAGIVVDLEREHEITLASPQSCVKKTEQCYLLRPKNSDSPFSKILVGVNQGKLTLIQMYDALGQTITTHFSHIELNTSLDPKWFVFSPPEGVDIIEAIN